jgi:hypothetical protein
MVASVVMYRSTNKGMSSGYSIRLFDGQNEIASYSAGGHPADSQAPGESPMRTVRRWALSTAKEIFSEHAGRLPAVNEIEVETETPDEE